MMRKICVVTGTRAEYGLLYWLMKAVQEDEDLTLQIIVTGMHLSPEFGLTYRTIENDGFQIDEKIEMLLSSDTPVGITKSMGVGLLGFADALARLQPDILVVLGDRYEILVAAEAALVANIPLAHLCGGETTEGAIDESIRHAVTKMAQIHFVVHECYRKRVIQLGEQPDRVYNLGDIGIDNIARISLMARRELEDSIGFSLGEHFFLVTYHPVTLSLGTVKKEVQALFDALEEFPSYKIIFTKPNSDTGGRIICQMLDDYVSKHRERAFAITSLGQKRYLSALYLCDAVIGNSSSGIAEAPLFRKPSVNIGIRQKGRLRMPSVIDCTTQCLDIILAIRTAIAADFLTVLQEMELPVMDGRISERVKDVLKEISLERICQKKFYDLR